ncbi:unnamed protein product [Allacma fusca]|uniref:Uncharacterized protein n=1 Tax=Allacma fusca TaxID=39272 RepID=A0A8J2LWK3_9HEXA|nr:unnamed protein product [Allacma fusca]
MRRRRKIKGMMWIWRSVAVAAVTSVVARVADVRRLVTQNGVRNAARPVPLARAVMVVIIVVLVGVSAIAFAGSVQIINL